ncbi:hypothetical protein, partial [Parenemella sanctibonifatiensis]|uniref:hypothetical protein n=1 Tax=Parenemella sanctibonifatiensis TaxID=2016505 RepID=UPI001E2881D7
DLAAAGQLPDRNGLTAAGRSYQKHAGRNELPQVPGSALNDAGQDLLIDILTAPGTTQKAILSGRYAGGRQYIRSDGHGVVFDSSGRFAYFGVYP